MSYYEDPPDNRERKQAGIFYIPLWLILLICCGMTGIALSGGEEETERGCYKPWYSSTIRCK